MKLFRAVIEANDDPKKIGRVKVRIFGLHTENNENSSESFNFIKTSDLPWAEIMGGTSFGLISGVGLSSVLRQGTWVWVVLHDDNPNKPVIIGTIIGENTTDPASQYSAGSGFCDPDGEYPKSDRLNRSDMNPALDSKYLTLSVLETPSGHLIEIDDTVGEESIKVTHKSGTYINIDNEGNVTWDVVGNVNWDVAGDLNMNITGTSAITSGGNMELAAPRIDLNK
jgi:hypothetical protein